MKKILPIILATITQKSRHQIKFGVNFEWSNQSLVYNIFRLFEIIFWARSGIKREVSASVVIEYGKITSSRYICWSLESKLVHKELEIRSALARLRTKILSYRLVIIPMATLESGQMRIPIGYSFAIASATTPVGKVQATTATVSQGLTITGSNTILFAGEWTSNGDDRSGVTPPSYNAVSMTLVNKVLKAGGTQWGYIDYLIAPATGALDTYLFTATGVEARIEIALTAYSGAKQSAVPDNGTSGQAVTNGSSVTTLVSTIISVTNSCWAILWDNDNFNPVTAGTNSTLLVNNHTTGDTALFDSGGSFTAGSFSMTINSGSGAANVATNMVAFAPFASAVIANPAFFLKMTNQ